MSALNDMILLCTRCGSRYRYEDRKKHLCDALEVPQKGEEIKASGSVVSL